MTTAKAKNAAGVSESEPRIKRNQMNYFAPKAICHNAELFCRCQPNNCDTTRIADRLHSNMSVQSIWMNWTRMPCVHHNRLNVLTKSDDRIQFRAVIHYRHCFTCLLSLCVCVFTRHSSEVSNKCSGKWCCDDYLCAIELANVCYARKLSGFVNTLCTCPCIGTTIERIMALCYLPSMRMQILWAVKLAISMQVNSFWKFYDLKCLPNSLQGVEWIGKSQGGLVRAHRGLLKKMSGKRTRVNWKKFRIFEKKLEELKKSKLMFLENKYLPTIFICLNWTFFMQAIRPLLSSYIHFKSVMAEANKNPVKWHSK